MKKIVFFSDTHTLHKEVAVPKGDILIFGGDLMGSGYRSSELIEFLDWFTALPHKHKVFCAGNHDRVLEIYNDFHLKKILSWYPDNLHYLHNNSVTINGIKIYGSPDTPFFYNWAFNHYDPALDVIYSRIHEDTDILLTHGPAYGILDQVEEGSHAGSTVLLERIQQLKNLKYHLFGHIHPGYGISKLASYTAINGSLVDDAYQIVNKPIVFDYEKGIVEKAAKTKGAKGRNDSNAEGISEDMG